MSLEPVFNACGLHITAFDEVPGGDISRAFCLRGEKEKYFLKVNEANRFPGMFAKEAAGLAALKGNGSVGVPEVIATGIMGANQYLLLEWIEKGSAKADFWEEFGRALAQMHRSGAAYFGWEDANYIGSLPQLNEKRSKWSEFYADCRVMPLVKRLSNEGFLSAADVAAGESCCSRFESLFPNETPALLHGDLWSGNFMIGSSGQAVIFDPAVYYGHREMDIGMSLLFGGFEKRFYEAYAEAYPFANGWMDRVALAQLYPLLVHAVLFGGHYIRRVKEIIRRYGG